MKIISSCLCGVNCKYSGGNNNREKYMDMLKNGECIPLCPEQLGGLTTPRNPAEILGSAKGVLEGRDKVVDNEGNDVTANFLRGAEEVLRIAKLFNIKEAILKEGSPSCGRNYIYNGEFNGTKIKGMGVTTYLLSINGIEVTTEEDKLNGII